MTKTTQLTQYEIDFKKTVKNYGPMQQAQLHASLRTGQRLGSVVAKGVMRFDIILSAFKINSRDGRPTGTASQEYLARGLSVAEAIAFFNAYEASECPGCLGGGT